MRPWDLNALVLTHVNRFFQAARRVTPGLEGKELASLLTMGGNLLWAHSAFADVPEEQERSMAVAGAAAGLFADRLDTGDAKRRLVAEQALDELERDLLRGLDPLLERLCAELADAGLAEGSPATVDRFVWDRLFRGYPWLAGQLELEAAIRERLAN